MKNIFKKIKKVSTYIGYGAVVIITIVPLILLIRYQRKKGNVVQITPEFKVKKVKNKDQLDTNILADAIQAGNEILKKIGKK